MLPGVVEDQYTLYVPMPLEIPLEFKTKSFSYTDCPRNVTDVCALMLLYLLGGDLNTGPYVNVSHETELDGVAHAEPNGQRFCEVEPAGQ